MNVVFDTNIYVSLLITPGGRAEEAFFRAVDGRCKLFTSVPILTETARILVDKFGWEHRRMEEAVRFLSSVASVIRPGRKLSVVRDEPDNRILECAVTARADLVVTGDRHLLVMTEYGHTKIVTLAVFLESRGDAS